MDGPAHYVRTEDRGVVRVLTIDHPPVNVLARPVLESLVAAVDAADAEPSVRALVLGSAQEKAFAAGADIREMRELSPDGARVHGARGQAVTRRLERSPLPVIAAVHGVCLGGGCELVLACDVVLASEDARFGQPEVNLGVMPGWGGTRRLPRRIGAARARRWILSGAAVSATEAHEAGLVDRVVPRVDLIPSAVALGEEFASKPPLAIAAAKFALLNAIDPEIDAGLEYELELWARLFGTDGQRAGMASFVEKRPLPRFDRSRWAEDSAGFPWAERSGERFGGKGDKERRPPSP